MGAVNDPALLLIGGATWSMDWRDDELCHRLVRRGRRVVRHVQRDTGRSTCWPPGSPGSLGAHLVGDAVAVLETLGIQRTPIVGLSMGGGIARRLALEHRDRCMTLTLITTSPIGPTAAPSSTYVVEAERPYGGGGHVRRGAAARHRRPRLRPNPMDMAASLTNHFLLDADGTAGARLSHLDGLPTLVLHGTVDPLFPLARGRALADAIPGARLIELDGVGHQLPPPRTSDLVVDALI